jgi:hypothetical protein
MSDMEMNTYTYIHSIVNRDIHDVVCWFVQCVLFCVMCEYCILTYLLDGAESFLRSYPVCSKSRNYPHLMEPKGSLLYS